MWVRSMLRITSYFCWQSFLSLSKWILRSHFWFLWSASARYVSWCGESVQDALWLDKQFVALLWHICTGMWRTIHAASLITIQLVHCMPRSCKCENKWWQLFLGRHKDTNPPTRAGWTFLADPQCWLCRSNPPFSNLLLTSSTDTRKDKELQ